MPDDAKFRSMRKERFSNWCQRQRIPRLSGDTYAAVFDYLLSEQNPDGSWPSAGAPWSVVQTSVILKALALLQFQCGDCWSFEYRGRRIAGSIDSALNWLVQEVGQRPIPQIGEDIWDLCQFLLALDSFGRRQAVEQHANEVNNNWRRLYQSACAAQPPDPWCGPAFLSAMTEVVQRYHSRLQNPSQADAITSEMLTKEVWENGAPTGRFQARNPHRDYDLWNTSLVLRMLCFLKDVAHQSVISRVAAWVLRESEDLTRRPIDPQRRPMFLARCLEGLRAALRWVDPGLRREIHAAIERGNEQLQAFWNVDPGRRIGDLKAYTAVGEYLAGETVNTPAGLLFDLAPTIERELRARPVDATDGLRIAWLSDIHIAQDNDERPYSMNLVKRALVGFKYLKGTPLTQRFQQSSLTAVLREVEKRKPDHILVTGDVSNYAKPEQFEHARAAFLATQRVIQGPDSQDQLDRRLWTILPGNHDVTGQRPAGGRQRRHLGMFFHYFSQAYDGPRSDWDETFPYVKELGGRDQISVRLIVLDSTCAWPVSVVGFNARGRIDPAQLHRLQERLSGGSPRELLLVTLHHHPIVVPEMVSDVEDYFLSLEEAEGRKLVSLCAASGVSAILHGHFHALSRWSGRAPRGRGEMQIIGAPSGTMGDVEQFLELREATFEDAGGRRVGLALYTHRRTQGDRWDDIYEAFIEPVER